MPIYDGVVTVAEDDIPVLIELDDDIIRLSASGQEIGEWRTDECEISHVGDSTYNIRAENETLAFIPNQPSLFAAAVNDTGSRHRHLAEDVPPEPEPEFELPPELEPDDGPVTTEPAAPAQTAPEVAAAQAPPPKPVTTGLFYALCVLTVALALWALVSMIF
ncbi:MAG: hypothetical protein WAL25_16020 [Acidimicrobiia bacterium]